MYEHSNSHFKLNASKHLMAYNPTCMETKQLNAKAQHQHIKS